MIRVYECRDCAVIFEEKDIKQVVSTNCHQEILGAATKKEVSASGGSEQVLVKGKLQKLTL